MVIQRYGSYFTKLQVGDQVVGINPPSKDSQLKQSRFGSDVALQSVYHPDFNGIDQLEHKSRECYAIRGPGEYEIADIFVHSFPSVTRYDGVADQINTLHSILFEGINVMYLGPISSTNISEQAQEELYQANVIFVPIGGDHVMGADEAFKFIKKFSPQIVIPIGYDEVKDKKELEAFASSFGERVQREDKLTIKKKDVEEERMDLVILSEIK